MKNKIGYGMMILLLFSAFPLEAAENDKEAITYRNRVMDGIRASMGSMGDILKGKVAYNDLMVNYAKTMHEYSQTVTTIFKQDTRGAEKKNRAKDEIWEKWADFEQKSQEFVDASAAMVAAAESKDMAKMGAAMKNLGQSCGSCHKPFRAKKR